MLSYMVRKLFEIKWTTILYHSSKDMPFFNMADKNNLRWAFKASDWKPTYEEILAASSYIQTDEKTRIARFVFQEDAKSSLLGRLMLRKFIHVVTSMPYEGIHFGRDSHQKPYLTGAGDTPLSFNVSHHGEYVVLAGNTTKNIGIDIMKIEPPVNKNVPEFFRLMTRQFSAHEWDTIKRFPTESEQMKCFYRIWCLKESYVKNIGTGLTTPLKEISFHINTHNLQVGEFVTDTVLYIDGVLKSDWVFEETLLEETYAVAVSLKIADRYNHEPAPYIFMNFRDLVREAKPLFEPDPNFSINFMNKEKKGY